MSHLSDRSLALGTVLGLTAASLGCFAAYITNPLLDYAARAEQSLGFGGEGHKSNAGKADLLVSTLDRNAESIIDAPVFTMTSPTAAPLLVAIPLPPRRPNHLPVVASGLLNDAQITGIKKRLGLSPTQEEHWPAVEGALRDVARRHLQGRVTRQSGAAPRIEVSSPEVQRLIEASVPLIRQLREDQKREVRELVRMIGLDTVASHI